MNINDCRKCLYHREEISDSVICRFSNEVNYFIVDRGDVVTCPKEFFKGNKTRLTVIHSV
jgi:hypothetical protein